MRFFTDPTPFTHRVRFYGFPAYALFESEDGVTLAGTNAVWDWCILHVAPHLHTACEFVLSLIEGVDYEPRGWRIEVLGTLNK